jgi:hypothetical protein
VVRHRRLLAPAGTSYTYDGGGETPVDDTGTVTVIGPEPARRHDEGCVIGIHSRDLSGATGYTRVTDPDPGCPEGSFENVDALTVLGGGSERATQFTLSRAAVGAPWAITAPAPSDSPGLVEYGYGGRRITTYFLYSSVVGSPIVAVASPDRHRVLVQVFDDTTRTWRPPAELYVSDRRCRDAYLDLPVTPALYVTDLRCGRSHVVLVSPDATTWTVRDVGRRPWTIGPGGATLPGRSRTTVVGIDAVRQFPVTTNGPCDVVQAGRPGELLRLHGARHGWPTKVQVSTGGAFHTVSTTHRAGSDCRKVIVFQDRVDLVGRRASVEGRFVLRGGTWRFRYLHGNPFPGED